MSWVLDYAEGQLGVEYLSLWLNKGSWTALWTTFAIIWLITFLSGVLDVLDDIVLDDFFIHEKGLF